MVGLYAYSSVKWNQSPQRTLLHAAVRKRTTKLSSYISKYQIILKPYRLGHCHWASCCLFSFIQPKCIEDHDMPGSWEGTDREHHSICIYLSPTHSLNVIPRRVLCLPSSAFAIFQMCGCVCKAFSS